MIILPDLGKSPVGRDLPGWVFGLGVVTACLTIVILIVSLLYMTG